MANAVVGRVLLISKGDYSASTTYKMLDWVRHDNKAWVCKQESIGNVPQDGAYWQLLAQDGAEGGYCYIRYSASADGTGFVATPTVNTTYVGFYTGNSDVAPTDKAEYTWSKFIGEDGKGISSIAKTNTSGLVDTYTITYSDSTTSTFNVTNGKDGSQNYYGTLITGNSTTPTVYSTGIEYANIGDSYTNTNTFFEYRCVLAGEEVVAKWVYVGSKKGADGLGSGDMLKATYDTNNNGIVDNAEKLGGELPSHYLYSLPIGGTSLGGVKNGGNVTIDEDGEMNADAGAGTWSDLGEKPFSTVGSNFLKVTPEGILDGDSTKLATLNVASANRLQKINVTGVGANNVNKWTKVGSLTSSGPYRGYSAILAVTDKVYATNTFFMSINFRTGNTSSAVETSSLRLNSFGNNGAYYPTRDAATSFKLVYTAPLFELWFNPSTTFLAPVITIVNETTSSENLMTYYSDQPYQDTAPIGTVLTCTPLPVTADQLPTASSSVKGGSKVGDGLTISNEVLSANVKGLINNKTDFNAQTVSTSQAVDSLLVKELLDDIDVSGGAGNVINITTQETSLFMREITATSENGEIATAKFNMVGQATLYAPFTGLITLSASNASGTEDSTKKIMSYNFKDFNIEMKFNELYGFCVDTTNNSPSGAVTYLAGYDNEFYTPAFMDYTTGKFNYGDWENAFFLSESRWVMLKSDGTIDYDLDRENHAKKASDGSASDVSNEAYDGNAMFACVNSYIKFWQEEGDLTKLYFAVSKKPLVGFQNYAHHDNNGNTMPYTFIRMFDGTLVSGKLRSLANNTTPLNNVTGTVEIGYAQANGTYWYTGLYNDRVLINNLLLLMGKSRDTQTTFGNGHYTGGSSEANYIKTGTMVDKGLFYGTNGTGVGVKVFGIENWWGNRWERIGGYMYVSNLQQVKLTYGTEDGSTTTGYNTTGSGYIAIPNSTIGGTTGGYTSVVSFYDKGFVPKTVSGSQSTHWCDGCWFANNTYAHVGGGCTYGFLAGAFCVTLHNAVSAAGWTIGASVSCKPPVN